MNVSTELFIILLVTGLMMIGAEIFVPGGILGAIGGLALFGAAIAGFRAFPGYGGYIAIGIVFLVGLVIYLWIKIFPNTRIGKRMTVSNDLSTSKSADPTLVELAGKTGQSVSPLRPAGYAMIGGRRVDVVTRGEMIAKDTGVRVVKVEGSRVIVEQIKE
jgi:membrane-bound serine protease (ClpP class)